MLTLIGKTMELCHVLTYMHSEIINASYAIAIFAESKWYCRLYQTIPHSIVLISVDWSTCVDRRRKLVANPRCAHVCCGVFMRRL